MLRKFNDWWSMMKANSLHTMYLLITFKIVVSVLIFMFLIFTTGKEVWSPALNFVMVASALVMAGAFLGFLFGIPRSPKVSGTPSAAEGDRYTENTNLEDISDWLTKIIVGVSLVELDKIRNYVEKASDMLAAGLGIESPPVHALATGIIVFYSIMGFSVGYIWTRTIFPLILMNTRRETLLQAEQLESIKKNMMDLAARKTRELIQQAEFNSEETELGTFRSKAEEDGVGLIDLQNKIDSLLSSKPPKDKTDLQKKRWGGKAKNGGKWLRAEVSESDLAGLFDVKIFVTTEDGLPLAQPVAIFVHDSFKLRNDVIFVRPDSGGVVSTQLIAFEAFTVGVYTYDGTELELDLNDVPGYPEAFYWEGNDLNKLKGLHLMGKKM